MFAPRYICTAAVASLVGLRSVVLLATAAPADTTTDRLWRDAFLPLAELHGRSLQTSLSCSTEQDAFTACMDTAMPNGEAQVCATCLDRASGGDTNDDSYRNCTAVNAYFCDPDKECQCLSPCRVQYATYIECLMGGLLANEGKDFVCDIDCGGNSGGGGGGGSRGADEGGSSGGAGVGSSSGGGADVGSSSGGGSDVGSSEGGGGGGTATGSSGGGEGDGGDLALKDEGPDSGGVPRASAFGIVVAAVSASASGLSMLL